MSLAEVDQCVIAGVLVACVKVGMCWGRVSVPALPLELGVLFALLALLGDFQSREKLEPCEAEKEEAEVPPEEIWHMEGAGSQKGLFSSAGRVTLST